MRLGKQPDPKTGWQSVEHDELRAHQTVRLGVCIAVHSDTGRVLAFEPGQGLRADLLDQGSFAGIDHFLARRRGLRRGEVSCGAGGERQDERSNRRAHRGRQRAHQRY
jgi:hypothetical protein